MNKRHLIILTALLLLMTALLTACSSSDDAGSAEPSSATAAPVEESADTDGEGHDGNDSDDGETEGHDDDTDKSTAEDTGEAESASSDARTFVVSPGESTASYIVNEEFLADALEKLGIEAGKSVVTGSTNDVDGSLTIDLENQTLSDGNITVNLTSLTTDQSRRDKWVQSQGPQFGRFPTATFTATGIEGAPEDYTEGEESSFQLMGDLSVRDVTVPTTFDVTATVEGDTLTGVAEASMNISDFGISPPAFARTLTVEDPFVIRVELTATAQ